MRNVIVQFNDENSTIVFPDGTNYMVTPAMKLEDAPIVDVLALVKAGLTAEDLINLKKAELL